MAGLKVVAQLEGNAITADAFRELRLLILRQPAQQQVLFFQHQQLGVFGLGLLAPFFKSREIVDTFGNQLIIEVEYRLLFY